MSVEAVKKQLEAYGLSDAYREFSVSSATVALAAQAIGCESGRIAKTLSILASQGPFVIVVMGEAKLDNHKYKQQFHEKAKFIPSEDVEKLIGHPVGGVCPFGLPEGVPVFLDVSLKAFDPCYPAAGASNNAVKISLADLERITGGTWIDVCKVPEA